MRSKLKADLQIAAEYARAYGGQTADDRACAFVANLAGTVRVDHPDLAEAIWSVLGQGALPPMVTL